MLFNLNYWKKLYSSLCAFLSSGLLPISSVCPLLLLLTFFFICLSYNFKIRSDSEFYPPFSQQTKHQQKIWFRSLQLVRVHNDSDEVYSKYDLIAKINNTWRNRETSTASPKLGFQGLLRNICLCPVAVTLISLEKLKMSLPLCRRVFRLF